jgi:hypothetical protein
MRRTAAVLVLALAASPAAAQEPAPPASLPSSVAEHGVSVVSAASVAEVSVGQRFIVDVRAAGPQGAAFSFPTSVPEGSVELMASAVAGLPFGVQRYEAVAVKLEPVEVPAIVVDYRLPDGRAGRVATAPIPLRFVTLLPKNPQQQKLEDVRPPQPLGIAREFWIAVGVLAALLVALAVWLWRRERAPAPEPEVAAPAEPPDVRARRALDELAAADLPSRAEFRAFYIQLAEIAKRYLEERLGAPVMEMTTSEAVVFLRGRDALRHLADILREVSEAADLVKFARGGSAREEAARHLAEVRRLVDGVEERLRPAPVAPAPGGGPAPGPTSLS